VNLFLMGLSVAGAESIRAENRILKSLSVKPAVVTKGPLVSVIIPAYNEERYLPALLTSLGNQSYSPIEVIVVDNLSDDNTIKVAKEFGAKVMVNPTPANVNKSRNIGASAARGEYLAFIDADTIPESNAILNSVTALQNGADLVYTNKCSTDDHLISIARVIVGWLDPVNHTATGCYLMTNRDVFNSVSGFDESLNPMTSRQEDGKALTARLVESGYNVVMLKGTYVGTSARRFHAEGYSTSSLWQERSIRALRR